MAKKLCIKTYGCQMNVYDSGRMADLLAPLGYATTEDAAEADLVILNTCHIREKAGEKVYSDVGRLRNLRAERMAAGGAPLTIAVAGCTAQAEGEEIMRRAPAVDLVVGPQAYHRLPELIARAHRSKGEALDTEFPAESKFDHLPQQSRVEGTAAFLTIQEGCDKFCTFCVVPYTRGAEWSRPVAAVLAEARELAARGVREVTLLGQNVNAYDGEGADGKPSTLARLAYALAEIPGLDRIRYTTSHPNDMSDALIAAHGDLDALMPWLHLPVQAGSDRILAAMNRGYTREGYLAALREARRIVPDIAVTTDIIVGFPSETDEEFARTIELVREARFDAAFTFQYSPRPGTAASAMPDDVGAATKKERLIELNAAVQEERARILEAQLGRRAEILLDGAAQKGEYRFLKGRTAEFRNVLVAPDGLRAGDLATVVLRKLVRFTFEGEIEKSR